MAAVMAMRFGEDGYFFVTDERFTYLGHPIRRNLVGTSMTAQVDPNGVNLGAAFRDDHLLPMAAAISTSSSIRNRKS